MEKVSDYKKIKILQANLDTVHDLLDLYQMTGANDCLQTAENLLLWGQEWIHQQD